MCLRYCEPPRSIYYHFLSHEAAFRPGSNLKKMKMMKSINLFPKTKLFKVESMRSLLCFAGLTLILLGLPLAGAAQYADGPIDLRMWVAESYTSNPGSDEGGDPAEHRWDWEFEDNLTGNLGSVPGCVEFTSSTYAGGWHDHPNRLIKSYIGAANTPSTLNWVASTANGSSYWEEDEPGNCHFNRGDDALCVLSTVGAPLAIRSVTPPHTYGYAQLFSEGYCDLGARIRVFYTTPAPASATGPAGPVAAGSSANFTAKPPAGSVEGGWASGVVFDYELETAPGSGDFNLACDGCSADVNLTMPNTPGTYKMRIRAHYSSGRPSQAYFQLSVEVSEPASGLPSPWAGSTVGGGFAAYNYNPSKGFTLETSTTNYDPLADNLGYIHRSLCGNGEIVVQIKSIDGPGYGGVFVRESTAPNSKEAGLATDFSPLLRWEQRATTGGAKQVSALNRPNARWLKLQRWGDWIFAYISSNGASFTYIYGAFIPMNNCVEIGFGAYSYIPGVPVAVVFDNVSVLGNSASRPGAGSNPAGPAIEEQALQPSLFPNPATDMLAIRFGAVVEQPTIMRLRNELGQVIGQRRLEIPADRADWDVSALRPGMYLIELITDGQPPQALRFIKR